MKDSKKPMANPFVILREEFDDWAILFNPDTVSGFGLNPIGVYLWKLFDGEHTIDMLLKVVQSHAENVPEEAEGHIGEFVDTLAREGLLVQCDTDGCASFCDADSAPRQGKKLSSHTPHQENEVKLFRYESPRVVDLRGESRTAHGDCTGGSGDSGWCKDGAAPGLYCGSGCNASYGTAGCRPGSCASYCCTGASVSGAGCQPGSSDYYCCITGTGCCNGYSG